MSVIKTENLSKFYGRKHRGIIDVNLEIEAGDYFGFIGPNGAGKSTTIRTLLGMISPTSGSAEMLGKPVGTTEVLRDIGYMASEAVFYDNMKVDDVINYSAKLYNKDCSEEIDRLCQRLSLDRHKKIRELSLGNRKKVSIVCAMAHDPKLYILDEPTSGLDPLMQKKFFDLLKEKNEAGATIFLSSHVLHEIQSNCKNAAIIKDGRIIACDSVDNLSKSNARRVVVEGIKAVPAGLEAKSIDVGQNQVTFLYSGSMKVLIEELSKLPVEDVRITEPELEEIFLHYYEK